MEILRAKNQFNETILSFYIDYEKQEATNTCLQVIADFGDEKSYVLRTYTL